MHSIRVTDGLRIGGWVLSAEGSVFDENSHRTAGLQITSAELSKEVSGGPTPAAEAGG